MVYGHSGLMSSAQLGEEIVYTLFLFSFTVPWTSEPIYIVQITFLPLFSSF